MKNRKKFQNKNVERRNKTIKIIFLLAIFVFLLFFIILGVRIMKFNANQHSSLQKTNVLIVSSIPIIHAMLLDFNVSFDYLVLKSGNPHFYELKPKDIIYLRNANLILTVGKLDDWILKGIKNHSKVLSIKTFSKSENSHYWFDLDAVKQYYLELNKRLNMIGINHEMPSVEFIDNIKSKFTNKTFVASVPTFNNLIDYLGGNVIYVMRKPDEQLSAQKLISLINVLKENPGACLVLNSLFTNENAAIINELKKQNIRTHYIILDPFPMFDQNFNDKNKSYLNFLNKTIGELSECFK